MLDVALSPCPNDIFAFYAWWQGFVAADLPLKVQLADVEQLNDWSMQGRFDLIKVSTRQLPSICGRYLLLPVGNALGFGCGPKLVAKEPFPLKELSCKRVALPGRQTTAHFLLGHLCPTPRATLFCRYEEVVEAIRSESVDCGVIIHETRFTFKEAGLCEIADLGSLWEERHGCPLPLGGIAAKRSGDLARLCDALSASIRWAWDHRAETLEFCRQFSQEMDEEVLQRHVDLYVNEETAALSPAGKAGLRALLACQDLPLYEGWSP